MLKQSVKQAVIILVVASVLGLVVYGVRPDKITKPVGIEDPDQQSLAVEDQQVADIPIDQAFDLYQANKAIFIDARHAVDYAAGHISGAIHLTTDQAESWLSDFIATTDPQSVIITYCDGPNCHLAPELAEFLFFNGFDHVFYLENGWTRWRDHGYPVE
ncbi:rhodanese domain protein [Desulfosarcina variabilis str. Montpellier]|uniref:rhodanese-like domain-containing protein n=1 Tax=Desulfosarcina variabilis TaxID=2300 RepID=UPI003AFB3A48